MVKRKATCAVNYWKDLHVISQLVWLLHDFGNVLWNSYSDKYCGKPHCICVRHCAKHLKFNPHRSHCSCISVYISLSSGETPYVRYKQASKSTMWKPNVRHTVVLCSWHENGKGMLQLHMTLTCSDMIPILLQTPHACLCLQMWIWGTTERKKVPLSTLLSNVTYFYD